MCWSHVSNYDDEATDKRSITGEGAKLIATHLKISPAISELVLCHGAIQRDEDGLFHIAEALQTNTSLTKLSLIKVHLKHSTEKCGSALVKMFQVNNSLEYLDLSKSKIQSAIHFHIFEGLQHNTTITHLNLHRTNIRFSDPDTARSLTKKISHLYTS